jgi:hypothetical protein
LIPLRIDNLLVQFLELSLASQVVRAKTSIDLRFNREPQRVDG